MNSPIDGLIANNQHGVIDVMVAKRLGYTVDETAHSFLGHLYALYSPQNEIVVTHTDKEEIWRFVPEYSQDLNLAYSVIATLEHNTEVKVSSVMHGYLSHIVVIRTIEFTPYKRGACTHQNLGLALMGAYLKFHEGKQNG